MTFEENERDTGKDARVAAESQFFNEMISNEHKPMFGWKNTKRKGVTRSGPALLQKRSAYRDRYSRFATMTHTTLFSATRQNRCGRWTPYKPIHTIQSRSEPESDSISIRQQKTLVDDDSFPIRKKRDEKARMVELHIYNV
jgi:hypothetical protein